MKILLLLLLAASAFGTAAYGQGVERWPVKTLADGAKIDTSILTSDIKAQNALPRPTGNWLKLPRQSDESQVTEISGTLTEYGIEADRDYHLVLSDGKHTMICEIPDPTIPALKHNIHKAEWTDARAFVDQTFGKPGHSVKAVKKPKEVTIKGTPLWDKPAHGSGHAVNGREIHPVLTIRLN